MDKFKDKYPVESGKPENSDSGLRGVNFMGLCPKDTASYFIHRPSIQLFWYGGRSLVEKYVPDNRLNWQLDLPNLSAQQTIHSQKTGASI